MPSLAVLSRLLLVLCLLVATTGGAAESVRMHLAMASAAASAQAEPPCHGDAMDTANGLGQPSAHHPAPHGSPSPEAPMDCCQSGHCDGICLLSLPPLPAALALAQSPPPPERHRLEASHDRPAPRLARPQRPPIA